MPDFLMPSLGAFMETGSLVEWKVKPGDRVKRGDIVAVVDTDKAAIEVEIWQDGVILELRARPGEKVPVGAVLAVVGADGQPGEVPPGAVVKPAMQTAMQPAMRPAMRPAMQTAMQADVSQPARAAEQPAVPRRVRASPAARQRARDLGVDLEKVTGTGPTGVVTVADIERAAAPGSAPAAEAPALSPMRRAIAAAMDRSNREIPHYYLSTDLDMSRGLAWLEAWNWTRPVAERILPVALLLKAVAVALAEAPDLNGFWVDGSFRASRDVHVGVAISLRQGGLVVPALHDVPHKPLPDVMRDLADLTARARSGTLRSSEITESTITVTNLGDRGAMTAQGVIFPPQVALVGFGRVSARPWVEAGEIISKAAVTATLAADHRASDGHRGSLFLDVVGQLLLEPENL